MKEQFPMIVVIRKHHGMSAVIEIDVSVKFILAKNAVRYIPYYAISLFRKGGPIKINLFPFRDQIWAFCYPALSAGHRQRCSKTTLFPAHNFYWFPLYVFQIGRQFRQKQRTVSVTPHGIYPFIRKT